MTWINGEFHCDRCKTVIGKNLNGDIPFALAKQHMETKHGGNGMLVLSRQINDKIVMYDERLVDEYGNMQPIVITVVEVRGQKARIGIEASKRTAVHRKEVYDDIRKTQPQLNLPIIN